MSGTTVTVGAAAGAKERAIENLKWTRGISNNLLKDFPEAKATYQPCATDNHLLWSLGHLACTYMWVANILDGKPMGLPESYNTVFQSVTPVDDPSKYPAFAEVRGYYDASFDRFVAAVRAMSEEQLSEPLKQDLGMFAKTGWDLVERAAWHEGWHAGQISSLRRALKLARVMG